MGAPVIPILSRNARLARRGFIGDEHGPFNRRRPRCAGRSCYRPGLLPYWYGCAGARSTGPEAPSFRPSSRPSQPISYEPALRARRSPRTRTRRPSSWQTAASTGTIVSHPHYFEKKKSPVVDSVPVGRKHRGVHCHIREQRLGIPGTDHGSGIAGDMRQHIAWVNPLPSTPIGRMAVAQGRSQEGTRGKEGGGKIEPQNLYCAVGSNHGEAH